MILECLEFKATEFGRSKMVVATAQVNRGQFTLPASTSCPETQP